MHTSDFDYQLPPELIAQTPAVARTASRMLVINRRTGTRVHRGVADLGEYLRAGDALVLNDTRVIPARLLGRRVDTGGQVEVFLLERLDATRWEALYRAAGRGREGLRLSLADGHITGVVERVLGAGRVCVVLDANGGPLDDALAAHGGVPVPPYIHRAVEASPLQALDRERYQTVYARVPGAVAAPTAGLHFSEDLLAALGGQGVRIAKITLHVGPGTFKPVKAEQIEAHTMEEERYDVSAEAAETIREARAAGGRVVAVGSTSVRTLETVAKARGAVVADAGRSGLFIYPPYAFRAVDVMLTNFHLPRSTLLMMVSAFAAAAQGGAAQAGIGLVQRAYAEAIASRYRFYSYGDCMLLL
ncbi:MAG: tRNA preQ1(34) S-adenosylmethionine ribosyltransferase-isomerase QueA [Verrucomicrobia bacterium]|nr:tRNA preQ1(34) S-adenosylmethionine ribosyltransferase-isomerase QueA [Verrucomicrobiota bacterium]